MLIVPAIFLNSRKYKSQIDRNSVKRLAEEYMQMGATHLHVIDVDGARMGTIINEESVLNILERVKIPIEVGGGIRSLKDIEHLLDLGVSRVVIGTKAVGNPAFVKDVISNFGKDRIVVSIDTKDGFVVTDGFEKMNAMRAIDHAVEMKSYGVQNICYVDASSKRHSSFSFCEEIDVLYKKTNLTIVAMGNIHSIKELERLKEVHAFGVVLEKKESKRELNIEKAIEIFEKGDTKYGLQENHWLY